MPRDRRGRIALTSDQSTSTQIHQDDTAVTFPDSRDPATAAITL
ncbi:hypothetical protein [Aquisphaera giovannonii]|nr:hypothetical protein [Aquisphaera giovannonii]